MTAEAKVHCVDIDEYKRCELKNCNPGLPEVGCSTCHWWEYGPGTEHFYSLCPCDDLYIEDLCAGGSVWSACVTNARYERGWVYWDYRIQWLKHYNCGNNLTGALSYTADKTCAYVQYSDNDIKYEGGGADYQTTAYYCYEGKSCDVLIGDVTFSVSVRIDQRTCAPAAYFQNSTIDLGAVDTSGTYPGAKVCMEAYCNFYWFSGNIWLITGNMGSADCNISSRVPVFLECNCPPETTDS